ncbi:uncharacterized protein LOC128724782 [Anopheles nili]|uniref:uncharacterized protein LOC128724782 n=1 Tax=Anopheles nili TaxID=185578 RepID=UPI00237B2249|nr:uncharacterized protein LOC128724782 [Anopheles nili]
MRRSHIPFAIKNRRTHHLSVMSSVARKKLPSVRDGRKCFLCHDTRHRNKHCRLFRFPARGTVMWDCWMEALSLNESDIRPNEQPRLCQRHFESKDFLTRQLSGMAVPVRLLENATKEQLILGNKRSSTETKKSSGNPQMEESQSRDLNVRTSSQPSSFCYIPQHKDLFELVGLQKARIERLLRINVQQRQIIEEQQDLLRQLGVHDIVSESELSSVAGSPYGAV